jgi:hypothetical protein
MAKIQSPFSLLASDDDPNRLGIYAAVYAELTRLGLNLPGRPYNEITRAQLENHLQVEAGKLMKEELKKNVNPDYSGKTDAEQTDLVNGFHFENGAAPPVNIVFIDLPFAPNALTVGDVGSSKQNNGAALAASKG